MMKKDLAEIRKKKKMIQSHIGQYLGKANEHLDNNVCVGRFP